MLSKRGSDQSWYIDGNRAGVRLACQSGQDEDDIGQAVEPLAETVGGVHLARDPAVEEIGNGAGQSNRAQYFGTPITGHKRGQPEPRKYESRRTEEVRGMRANAVT